MSDTVAVIIASYGDQGYWDEKAKRAIASVEHQTRPADHLIRLHLNSLQFARNHGAHDAKTKWLCFLDADDELEPEYLEKMLASGSDMELRYPAVRYVSESVVNPANYPTQVILPVRPLWQGNYMVIGTLLTRELFFAAGGFRDLKAYEDWDLWIRCWMLGANPKLIPDAIYRAWQRPESRNKVQNSAQLCTEILDYNRKWQNAKRTLDDHNGRSKRLPD